MDFCFVILVTRERGFLLFHPQQRRVIMFDDLLGGMFDFNGDGHTDFTEEAVGFAVIEDMMSDEDSPDESEFDTKDEW